MSPRFAFAPALLLGLLATACAAERDKPVALLNGRDFSGWEFVTSPAVDIAKVCTYRADGSVAAAGQPLGYLATTTSHKNYRFHVEWRWSGKPGNGGVLVHIAGGPKDKQWPECYQAQLKNKAVGDLLPMAGATFTEPLTTAPGAYPAIKARTGADSEKPVGEWNSCDIVCRGDSIEITVNGVLQNKVTGCSVREGKVGLQFEGVAYEFRNPTLQSLD